MSVPIAWDATTDDLPDGYDGALVRSVTGHQDATPATTFCLMAAAVASDHSRRGLAGQVIAALGARARAAGLLHLLAPLRPTLKHRYPVTPMDTYATWTRPDGLSIDPWIRTHQRLGATVLGTAARSMTVTGTVAEWESWATMAFPALVDWAFVGDGAVGEDLGNHVPDAVFDLFWAAEDLPVLDEACFTAYLAGLREAGWSRTEHPDRHVRLGVVASCVKYTWLLPLVLARASDTQHAAYHQAADAHHLYAQRGLAFAHLIAWCREALTLIDQR